MFKLAFFLCMMASGVSANQGPLRYVALGDSYTIGTGAVPDESWPTVITSQLKNKGVAIELVANLGRNGWTTQDLIDYELPRARELKPDVVTVLIGVNDWVQGVPSEVFQKHLEYILGELLNIVPNPKHILVITIPDFSVTPTGRLFANGRDIAQGIKGFNQIIIDEAGRHHLKTADLFALSQAMGQDPSLIAADGLHPSAKEYAQWAASINPNFIVN